MVSGLEGLKNLLGENSDESNTTMCSELRTAFNLKLYATIVGRKGYMKSEVDLRGNF